MRTDVHIAPADAGIPDGVTFEALPAYPASAPFTPTTQFPFGVWYTGTHIQSDIDSDQGAGINTYVVLSSDANWSLIESNGMKTLVMFNMEFPNPPASVDGWCLTDEIDMVEGNAEGAAAARVVLNGILDDLDGANDTRVRYINYGKGVMFWNFDYDAARYVNEFADIVSADVYWYTTDPNDTSTGTMNEWEAGIWYTNSERRLTAAECQRARNYGDMVRRLKYLDAMDDPNPRKVLWNFVEVGRPSGYVSSVEISPDEIKGAVWHSIIAGAQGIVWFNHSFSEYGSHIVTGNCLREETAYANERAAVIEVSGRVQDLAAVLASDTASGYVSHASTVRSMVKRHGGYWYVFAGIDGPTSTGSHTFTVAGGSGSTVEVVNESRTVALSGGQFSDSFAYEYTTHIYKVAV